MRTIRIIDLFAGIGGIRCGLELAAREAGLDTVCVFTSEIKPYAVRVLSDNHPGEVVHGDISKIETSEIPDFDILCAGFPCQPFSSAGKRLGFADTRGTLFFEVERILSGKRPSGFILENVEGLVQHDKGRTLCTIVHNLEAIGYHVSYRVLNSKYFGVPQERKRIYITGTFSGRVPLESFSVTRRCVGDILQSGLPLSHTPFINLLLSKFPLSQLFGKSVKDKRGGSQNIHSWDLELKGPLSAQQKSLMDVLLRERRKKKWADDYGIDWMDGMPLTLGQIRSFCHDANLEAMLSDLSQKGYLKLEHPKKLVKTVTERGASSYRVYDTSKEPGYNIVAGKLSFEVSKILDPADVAPTLVAMDMQKLYVPDSGGLRRLSLREGLRLFGYPEDYKFDVSVRDGYDLLGNTVVVPVIRAVAQRLLSTINFN